MTRTAPDRPAWTEIVGVLAACAVLFVVIAKLDRAAADRATGRARAAHVVKPAPERAQARSAIPAPAVGLAAAGVLLGIAGAVVLARGRRMVAAPQPPPLGVTR